MTTARPIPTASPAPKRRFGWVKWMLLGVALLIGAPAGCVYAVFISLSNSVAAKMGATLAEANPVVAAKLGTPLKRGRFVTGSIKVENAGGMADIVVPLTGPKGSGQGHIKATKANGEWRIDSLTVQPDDGSARIDVLGGGIRS